MHVTNRAYVRLGLAVMLLCLLIDQLSKWLLLDVVAMGERPIALTPFFNLVLVWNYGVSFGMFAGHNLPLVWIIISSGIVLILLGWLIRTPSKLVACALGSVMGGALGNVVDRVRFGAVADFFDFYIGPYHWPAFNIADSCIFIGVVLLCMDSMFNKDHSHKGSS